MQVYVEPRLAIGVGRDEVRVPDLVVEGLAGHFGDVRPGPGAVQRDRVTPREPPGRRRSTESAGACVAPMGQAIPARRKSCMWAAPTRRPFSHTNSSMIGRSRSFII